MCSDTAYLYHDKMKTVTAKVRWCNAKHREVVCVCFQDKYRIYSIRHRGYYLFHHVILCSFFSRVATNREWRLLNSGLSVKSFGDIRALRKASFIRLTKNYDAVTFLISRHKRHYHASHPRPLQHLQSYVSDSLSSLSVAIANLYWRTANLLYYAFL